MRSSKGLPVPWLLKVKMGILKHLGRVPSVPHIPYCEKKLCDCIGTSMAFDNMLARGCFEKEGRFFRRPCKRLRWKALHPMKFLDQCKAPIEQKLLDVMGWPHRLKSVYSKPVPLVLKIKIRILQLLHKAPKTACAPFCSNWRGELSYYSLLKRGCLEKSGRIFRMPCRLLRWVQRDPSHLYLRFSLKMLELMGWEPPLFPHADWIRSFGFKGEISHEYEEKPSS